MFHLSGCLIALAFYFLPTIIANSRNVHSRGGILMLNLFLGWTFIGWVVALNWALTAAPAYYGYMRPPYPPYYR